MQFGLTPITGDEPGPPGANGTNGTNGATGPGYLATSTTSFAIGTGSKAFTTQAGLAYVAGDYVRAISRADPANYMEGSLTSYSGTTWTLNSTITGGSGTHTDWDLTLFGKPGATGPAGTGDVVGPGSATDNALARFDSTTGKLIQNGVATEDDAGNITATSFVGPLTGNVTGNTSGSSGSCTGNAATATLATTATTAISTKALYANVTPVTNAGSTSEVTLHTFSLPANSLAADGDTLIIRTRVTFAAAHVADTLDYKIYFGADDVTQGYIEHLVSGLDADDGFTTETFVERTSSTTATVSVVAFDPGSVVFGSQILAIPSIDLTGLNFAAGITIKDTGQDDHSRTPGDVTSQSMFIGPVNKAP